MKALTASIIFAFIVLSGVNQVLPGSIPGYETAWAKVTETISPAPTSEPVFVRGKTTETGIRWQDMPCRNNRTGEYYESEIISPEEIEYNLVKAGFSVEKAHVMMAIAKAESGHQLRCRGDEALANSKWDDSYGLYQIRGLKTEQGKGSCRDIGSFATDVFRQSQCAYEISGGGNNFSPWSMYQNGKYRKWL